MSVTSVQVESRLLEEARSSIRDEHFDVALDRLRRLLLLNPSVAAPWLDLDSILQAARARPEETQALARALITGDSSGQIQDHVGVRFARRGNFKLAVRAFQSAFSLKPGDLGAGAKLVTALAKSGEERAAFRVLSRMVTRARANPDKAELEKLAEFIGRHGGPEQKRLLIDGPESAALAIFSLTRSGALTIDEFNAISRRDDLFANKTTYYSINSILAPLWEKSRSDAVQALVRLSRNPIFADIRGPNDQLTRQLLDLASQTPGTQFSKAIHARFRDDDIETSIHCLARAIENTENLPAECHQVVQTGEFAGHPLWHLCNPFFIPWYRASSDSGDVQKSWADNPSIAAAGDDDVLASYQRWRHDVPTTAKLVRGFVDKIGADARYLDVGCGTGLWLRFLAEDLGVDLTRLHGTDLHANRTASAARLLGNWATTNDIASSPQGIENRVFPCDVLRKTTALKDRLGANIDAVMLFFVTGCFEDDALASFLEGALSNRPRYVFHATVADRWTLYRGRSDDEKFFTPLGYHLTERTWAGDAIHSNSIQKILLPLKYWPNPRVDIFERE
jgi:tetratricopeptide (TPR) repeat protein/SAM-dependent methyltransferase